MNKPIVTFVAISWREINEIYMFIGMLLCQKNPNWKCIIWHDEPNPWMRSVVEQFNDPRITFIENDHNLGSWGCWNRMAALKVVDTPYIINCTIQEYYLPITVDEIEKNMGKDIIVWNTIHHSFNYLIIDSELKIARIDWSNFAIKTEIARTVGIKQPEHYCADGIFIEDCVASGLLKDNIKLTKILSIKN